MSKSVLFVGLLSLCSYVQGMESNIPFSGLSVLEHFCTMMHGDVSSKPKVETNLSNIIVACQTPVQTLYANSGSRPDSSPQFIMKTGSFDDSQTTVPGRKVSFDYPVVTAVLESNGRVVGKFK